MQLLSKAEIKALIDGVWSGQYDPDRIPYWLFDKIATGLDQAAAEGWGNQFGKGAIKDVNLESALQKNVFYFAASKSVKELDAFHKLYSATGNKYQFTKEAIKLNQLWNFHWYNTEYNVTNRLARAGREWQRIEATKEYYPKLRFISIQDANTRDSHAALNGIVRPVEDPFWQTYFPPLDWNCRCRVERVQVGANTALKGKEFPPVKDQFKDRVTDSKRIWAKDHPYFKGMSPNQTSIVETFVAQKIAEVAVTQTGIPQFASAKEAGQWLVDQKICNSVAFPRALSATEAQDIAEYLYTTKQKHGFNPIDIKTKSMKGAHASASGKVLNLNSASFGRQETEVFKSSEQFIQGRIDYVKKMKNNIQIYENKLNDPNLPSHQRPFYIKVIREAKQAIAKIESYDLKFKDPVYYRPGKAKLDVVIHEFGHVLHDQKTGGINSTLCFSRGIPVEEARNFNTEIMKMYYDHIRNGKIFNNTKYAGTDYYEFLAESWVKYETAPDLLDIELKKLLDKFNDIPIGKP